MNFPDDSQRLMVIGPTGSGKTVAALWHLSHRRFHEMPWLVYNYKRDHMIDGIPYASHIDVLDFPVRPGIYIVHPEPDTDNEAVETQLRAAWREGYTGIMVDEMLMMGQRNAPLRLLLTQGRSLYCPIIGCTQRPAWVDSFAFTESDFIQVFRLRKRRDVQTVQEYVPEYDGGRKLPRYYSYYYDVVEDQGIPLRPVPPISVIHATFARRLARRRVAV